MTEKIIDIAKKIGLNEKNIELYGSDKAKLTLEKIEPKGRLILVSAINPTKYGEGKTTVSIGLADGMRKLGLNAMLALREPSLGPVFGVKGGATGGGKASLTPSDDINLHFTGDFHAITSTNNLLCALIDNHLFHGNALNIDENRILFHRCMDMNDRALREITISQERLKNNVERKDNFVITAASEIMAILCLANDLEDLKKRLGNILIAFSKDGKPIYARDLKAQEAMTILLKDAVKPNLVRTLEGTPAIVHGGPFANIAHGCNSVIATKYALSLADYVITEAGFGGDLGGEKFIDLKCRLNKLNPSVAIIVATVKAIKEHAQGGDMNSGLKNLEKHINNFRKVFGKETIVAINKFDGDSDEDLNKIKSFCKSLACPAEIANAYMQGGDGCVELAKKVKALCDKKNTPLKFAYKLEDCIEEKILSLAKNIYGAAAVEYSPFAKEKLKQFEKLAKGMPICIAKTQYSLSDDDKLLGVPQNFTLHVRDIELKNGAGFIVVIAGKISLMPGLPLEPNSENMTIDKNGEINQNRKSYFTQTTRK